MRFEKEKSHVLTGHEKKETHHTQTNAIAKPHIAWSEACFKNPTNKKNTYIIRRKKNKIKYASAKNEIVIIIMMVIMIKKYCHQKVSKIAKLN